MIAWSKRWLIFVCRSFNFNFCPSCFSGNANFTSVCVIIFCPYQLKEALFFERRPICLPGGRVFWSKIQMDRTQELGPSAERYADGPHGSVFVRLKGWLRFGCFCSHPFSVPAIIWHFLLPSVPILVDLANCSHPLPFPHLQRLWARESERRCLDSSLLDQKQELFLAHCGGRKHHFTLFVFFSSVCALHQSAE